MTSKSPSSDGRDLSVQPDTNTEVERRWCLCGIDDGQMSGYGNTRIVWWAFITQHIGQCISDTSWVYKKHLIEASDTAIPQGSYQPKWKRQSTQHAKQVNKRGNSICTNYGRVITQSFAPISKIIGIFNIHTNNIMGSPFVLCHQCYCYVSNQLHCKNPANHVGPFPKQALLLITTIQMQTWCQSI